MHSNRDIYRVLKSIPIPEWRSSGLHRTADIDNVETRHSCKGTARESRLSRENPKRSAQY
jgi:hypothetical protein